MTAIKTMAKNAVAMQNERERWNALLRSVSLSLSVCHQLEAVGELVNSTVTLVGDPVGNSPSIIALKLLLEVVADDVLVVSVVSTISSVVVISSIGELLGLDVSTIAWVVLPTVVGSDVAEIDVASVVVISSIGESVGLNVLTGMDSSVPDSSVTGVVVVVVVVNVVVVVDVSIVFPPDLVQ